MAKEDGCHAVCRIAADSTLWLGQQVRVSLSVKRPITDTDKVGGDLPCLHASTGSSLYVQVSKTKSCQHPSADPRTVYPHFKIAL